MVWAAASMEFAVATSFEVAVDAFQPTRSNSEAISRIVARCMTSRNIGVTRATS